MKTLPMSGVRHPFSYLNSVKLTYDMSTSNTTIPSHVISPSQPPLAKTFYDCFFVVENFPNISTFSRLGLVKILKGTSSHSPGAKHADRLFLPGWVGHSIIIITSKTIMYTTSFIISLLW